MGTRCLTHIKDEEGKILVTIYRQFDGYLSGHGKDLVRILDEGEAKLTNGFSPGKDECPKVFNGMGCLAAYLIGELKNKKIGNIYINPPDLEDYESYTYTLYPKEGEIYIKVVRDEVLYDGLLNSFSPYNLAKRLELC